jgi:hypothetical protein
MSTTTLPSSDLSPQAMRDVSATTAEIEYTSVSYSVPDEAKLSFGK